MQTKLMTKLFAAKTTALTTLRSSYNNFTNRQFLVQNKYYIVGTLFALIVLGTAGSFGVLHAFGSNKGSSQQAFQPSVSISGDVAGVATDSADVSPSPSTNFVAFNGRGQTNTQPNATTHTINNPQPTSNTTTPTTSATQNTPAPTTLSTSTDTTLNTPAPTVAPTTAPTNTPTPTPSDTPVPSAVPSATPCTNSVCICNVPDCFALSTPPAKPTPPPPPPTPTPPTPPPSSHD